MGWAVFLVEGRNLQRERLETQLGLKADHLKESRDGNRSWQINSRLSGKHSLSEHVEDILMRLLPARKAFRSLPGDLEARMVCTVLTRHINRGSLSLPPRQLMLIGSIGCILDVHFEVRPE